MLETKKKKTRDLTQSYSPTPTESYRNKKTTHKRHQNFKLRSDCGPNKDGQLEL